MSKVIKYRPGGQISKKEKHQQKKQLKEQKQVMKKVEKKQQELSKDSADAILDAAQFLRTLARKCILEKADLPQQEHEAVIAKHEQTWIKTIGQINIMHPEIGLQKDGFRNYVTKTLPQQAEKSEKPVTPIKSVKK